MMNESTRVRRRPRRAWPLTARIAVAFVTVSGLALLLAACSGSTGSGVASVGSSAASASSSPNSSASNSPLAYANCMRTHGIADFPDPDSSGNFDLGGGGDLNPTDPTYQAATQACRSLGSAGKGSAPPLSPQQIAASVQFAQCMRDHGITNYPDPDSNGNIPGVRHFGVDPNSAQFQPAVDACKHYMSGIPGWS